MAKTGSQPPPKVQGLSQIRHGHCALGDQMDVRRAIKGHSSHQSWWSDVLCGCFGGEETKKLFPFGVCLSFEMRKNAENRQKCFLGELAQWPCWIFDNLTQDLQMGMVWERFKHQGWKHWAVFITWNSGTISHGVYSYKCFSMCITSSNINDQYYTAKLVYK